MRKILAFTFSICISLGVFAQVPGEDASLKQNTKGKKFLKEQKWVTPHKRPPKRKKITYERYFNYYMAMDSVGLAGPNPQNTGFVNVHKDSLVIVPENGDGFGIFYHSVGMMIEPTSIVFNDLHGQLGANRVYTEYTNWRLDSIRFPYAYDRPVDSAMFPEFVTKQDTAYEFMVNGMHRDSLEYNFDTTWMYTNTDTTALSSWRVDFFDNAGEPDIIETVHAYPPYNLYDTAQTGMPDTQHLQPDTTIYNSMRTYNYQDTNQVKKHVVDTLYIDFYRERVNDGTTQSLVEGFYNFADEPGETFDTIRFMAPTYSRGQRRGRRAFLTQRVLLTEEEATDSVSKVIRRAVGLTANNRKGQEMVMGATVTFSPGYPYKPNDTILDATTGSVEYKNNSFRIFRYWDESGYRMTSYNNGVALLTDQIYYPNEVNDFLQQVYLPQNSSQNADGGISAMLFYNMDFHLTATNTGLEDMNSTGSDIMSAYPNPVKANSSIQIDIDLKKAQNVNLALFNTIGQPVKKLGNKQLENGKHSISMSTDQLEPGIYFLKLKSENHEETAKISIVK